MTSEDASKKIIIDEDWKDLVAREKATADKLAADKLAADKLAADNPTASGADDDAIAADQPPTVAEPEHAEPAGAGHQPQRPYALPPATLSFLITTLGTQAMVALGEIPNPINEKFERRQPEAKHFIDTLSMLEQKTAGNRTPEESSLLTALLNQLRMAFVIGPSTREKQ